MTVTIPNRPPMPHLAYQVPQFAQAAEFTFPHRLAKAIAEHQRAMDALSRRIREQRAIRDARGASGAGVLADSLLSGESLDTASSAAQRTEGQADQARGEAARQVEQLTAGMVEIGNRMVDLFRAEHDTILTAMERQWRHGLRPSILAAAVALAGWDLAGDVEAAVVRSGNAGAAAALAEIAGLDRRYRMLRKLQHRLNTLAPIPAGFDEFSGGAPGGLSRFPLMRLVQCAQDDSTWFPTQAQAAEAAEAWQRAHDPTSGEASRMAEAAAMRGPYRRAVAVR